ncbi:MAG TPA: TRCF domain-containing protein, partial [Pyrinomonadaceae bacterium]|nr:TRCF domain-containing protein [Pyrinomonadaceae bacterium]
RYGSIPYSVENLFAYGRLRKLAENMGIISIDKAADSLAIKLGENAKVDPEKLMALVSENESASFSPSGILRVEIGDVNPIEQARSVLLEIRK